MNHTGLISHGLSYYTEKAEADTKAKAQVTRQGQRQRLVQESVFIPRMTFVMPGSVWAP